MTSTGKKVFIGSVVAAAIVAAIVRATRTSA